MKILLLVTSFNGLSQRVHRELTLMGHSVSVEFAINEETMVEAVELFQPQLIISPFLKQKIPDSIWSKTVCLVLHPGIEGDRGPSALDWAISNRTAEWGVTLLQANEEFDAGDIWGTHNFDLRRAAKSSVYRREVTAYATQLIKQAVLDFECGNFKPRQLTYQGANVQGIERPLMRQTHRQISWDVDTTETIINKINSADSSPGVLDELLGEPCYIYGARASRLLKGKPGELLGQKNGWLCKASSDGAVWFCMAKQVNASDGRLNNIKLPAAQVLAALINTSGRKLKVKTLSEKINDIYWQESNQVAYLFFDIYNGAFDTDQCKELQSALKKLKRRRNKVIVLMGGDDFWCNGIQLNKIEASSDPAKEAMQNIIAIDDLIAEIIYSPKHITIAAVRSGAGAGGAIMPLACDKVILRDGVVLNPHYATMGLFGSEYWTYLLPRRVGEHKARVLMQNCLPVLASEAHSLGMADGLLSEDWDDFHQNIMLYAEQFTQRDIYQNFIKQKSKQLSLAEKTKPLKRYRQQELDIMRDCFMNPNSDFHNLRHAFVQKISPSHTPLNLARHRCKVNMHDKSIMPTNNIHDGLHPVTGEVPI